MKKICDVPVPSSAPSRKVSRSKPKKVSSGHKMCYSDMITSAVKALRKNTGTSRQAIAKYVKNNYDVSPNQVNRNVSKNIKQMISTEKLVLTKGCGAAGRYKLSKKPSTTRAPATPKKKVVKKTQTPTKKKTIKKPIKKRSPVKKKTAKRVTKKPTKPGKRTGKNTKKPKPKK